MRSSLGCVLLLFSCSVFAVPDIQTWETENGSQVLFVESHQLPMVDLQIIFDAGSARDNDKSGLATLTNHLLAEGAAGKTVDEISQGFESLGAQYSSDVGYDSAAVGFRSLSDPDKLDSAVDNFIAVVSQPDFPEQAFERERKRTLIGIQAKKQSPSAIASEAFYALLYNDHPYAKPSEGTEASLNTLTVTDLQAFHKQHYVAANSTIAIVGDLTRQQAETIAQSLSASLPKGTALAPIPSVEPLTAAKTKFIEHPSGQMHILVGQPGIKRGDPDYFPLYVGNHVLGGGGMVSRLFKDIREQRGLTYSVYSYFNPMREAGPFIAGLPTRADQADEAIAVLQENLNRYIDEGPTEAELTASKKNITGGFPLRIDSNSKILGYLAVIGFYGLPLDYLDHFNQQVEQVTVEQIKDAFARRLNPEVFVTIKVGPKPATEKDS